MRSGLMSNDKNILAISKAVKSWYFPIIFVAVFMTIIGFFTGFFNDMPFWLQFLLVGLPITLLILFYFSKEYDGWKFFASVLLVTYALDLVQPPYMVSVNGVISSQPMLSATSIDYVVGTMFAGFGFTGTALFYMTYVVAFAIFFAGAHFLSGKKKTKGD